MVSWPGRATRTQWEAAHVDNLQRLIGFSDQHPQLKTQLQGHLEISKRQCDEIKHKLKRLGTDTSTLKGLGHEAGRLDRAAREQVEFPVRAPASDHAAISASRAS
jgi:hypothetical protein